MDVAGAGVSGRVGQAGQVQGEQVGQGEQQPGQPGRVAAGELAGEVGVVLVGQGTGPGQVVAAGPAAGGVRAAPDPRQPPSRASTVPISSIEWPCARSSMIRVRAASLPGAVFGPGRGSAKKSRAPPRLARKSRTAEYRPVVV